jgi:hypothetical protein
MAPLRGARVSATAGDTFADQLRTLGATVTRYRDGMVERVREIISAPPDLVFDAAPVNLNLGPSAISVLPDLVKIAGGDPRRVLTCVDFAEAAGWASAPVLQTAPKKEVHVALRCAR